jgi:thiol:disulfide interchange protein
MEPNELRVPRPVSGPQTRLPRILLSIAAAAVAFRIVTVITERTRTADGGAGLVVWQTAASATPLSQKSHKPILYDFTAAWCVPCHQLDTEGWKNPAVARSVGARFVATRIVDRQREDHRNPEAIEELQHRYNISAFPTLVVADASGREIARMEGFRGLENLQSFLDDAAEKAKQPAAQPEPERETERPSPQPR